MKARATQRAAATIEEVGFRWISLLLRRAAFGFACRFLVESNLNQRIETTAQ
jgi:hypothetical protein